MGTFHLGVATRLCCLLVFGACGGANPALRAGCELAPKPGLYEVVTRDCENPLHETDYCPLTQYLEIAKGEVYGVSDQPNVLAFWYAERRQSIEYSYVANAMLGRCPNAERYVIDSEAQSEASLTLRGRVPVEYHFVSHTEGPHPRLLFRMRFSLRPVARTPEIDLRLHIVRD